MKKQIILLGLVLILFSVNIIADDNDYAFLVDTIKYNNGTPYSHTNTTIIQLYDSYTGGSVTYNVTKTIQFDNGTAVFWLYDVDEANYTDPVTYLEMTIGLTTITPRWNVSFKRFNKSSEMWNIANNDSFVPYDGAIKNINLGNNNFTVNTDTFFVDSSNGRVCMGEGNCTADFHATNVTSLTYDRYNDGVAGPFWYIRHARGTVDSPTILQDGDYLMSMSMFGWNGTDWLDAAKFLFEINGTPSGKSMPTEFSIFTREENAVDSTKKFSIYQDGKVRWATTDYFNCTLKTDEQGNMVCGNYSTGDNITDHEKLKNLGWSVANHTIDTNFEVGNNNLSVNQSTLFVDSDSQKVGIGTTTPKEPFVINGTLSELRFTGENSGFNLYNPSNSGGIQFYITSGGGGGGGFSLLGESHDTGPGEVSLFYGGLDNIGTFSLYRQNTADLDQVEILDGDESGNLTFNEGGNPIDFRIESDNNANLFYTSGVSDKVGIGTNSPSHILNVVGTVNVTDVVLADNCADGQILKWAGGVGTCGTDVNSTTSLWYDDGSYLKNNISYAENVNITGNLSVNKWISSDLNLGLDLTDDGSDLILHADVGGTNSLFMKTDGTFLSMIANPGPANDYLMFSFAETQGDDTYINMYEGASGHNRFWDSGSMRIGGTQSNLCSILTDVVDCDTSTTGADLVLQDDFWSAGSIYSGNGTFNVSDDGSIFTSSVDNLISLGCGNITGEDACVDIDTFEGNCSTANECSEVMYYTNATQFVYSSWTNYTLDTELQNNSIVRYWNWSSWANNGTLIDTVKFDNDTIVRTNNLSNYIQNQTDGNLTALHLTGNLTINKEFVYYMKVNDSIYSGWNGSCLISVVENTEISACP